MAWSLDEFTAASRPYRPVCSVAKVLEVLDEKDAAVLRAALANPDVTAAAIEAVLGANGHTVRQSTVSRHRRQRCACGG